MQNNPRYIIFHTTDVVKSNKHQFYPINDYHRDIRKFPKSSLGFFGGYHVLINGGKEYRYRTDSDVGAHCNDIVDGVSMNFKSLGIAIGFDGDLELPNDEDVQLLLNRIKTWQLQYNIPNERVLYHRNFTATKTCPGSMISNDWLAGLLNPPEPNREKTVKQVMIDTYNLKLINLLRELVLRLKQQIDSLKGRF